MLIRSCEGKEVAHQHTAVKEAVWGRDAAPGLRPAPVPCLALPCCQLFVSANTKIALNSHALIRYNKLEREQISSLIFLGKGL